MKGVVVASLLVGASSAAADKLPAPDGSRVIDVRRGYVRADFGFGLPTGYYGLAFGYAVHDDITLEADMYECGPDERFE